MIYSWNRKNVLQVGQVEAASICQTAGFRAMNFFLDFFFIWSYKSNFFPLCTCSTFGMIFFQGISDVEQNASSVEITTVYLKANSVMA